MGSYFANRDLLKAFKKYSIDEMKAALRKGADVDLRVEGFFDSRSRTILYIAVEKNDYNIAKFLLENGANVNAVDLYSTGNMIIKTPLMRACEDNNKKMVELLLKYGANVNQKCRNYDTALHFAVKAKNFDIVKMLVAKGANIRAKNYSKYTALSLSAKINSVDIKNFLYEEEKKLKIKEAKVNAGWKLISSKEISVTIKKDSLGYSVCEVFNFAAKERTYTTIYKNLTDGHESHNVKSFDEFSDKRKIEAAFNMLIKKGGKAERQDIFGDIMGKRIIDKKVINKPKF